MKTPLTYYGGKQQLAKTILSLISEHRLYCEPFVGGGAVFFAKPPADVEVINDTNGEIVNFYAVLQRDFAALQREIKASLNSRQLHRQAQIVNENPDMFSPVKRAWAIWVLANMSYGSMLDGTFGYGRTKGYARKIAANRTSFAEACTFRLQNVQIECCDALRIIKSRDTPDSFFYCDPPYVGADQGHYDGYTQEDFDALLSLLAGIRGRFILSSYRNKALHEAAKDNGWSTVEIRMASPMTHGHKTQRKKIEVLTANYPIAAKFDEQLKKQPANGEEEAEN